jgi:hypothetical protein
MIESKPTSSLKAQNAVNESVDRFEHAMETLALHIEETSAKFQHVMDLASQQRRELSDLKDRAEKALAPMKPYVSQIRRNPAPYLAALALVSGAIALVGYQRRKSRVYSASSDDSVVDATRVSVPKTAPGELTY